MVQFAREVSARQQVSVTRHARSSRHAPRADLYAPELFRALRVCESAPEYDVIEPSAGADRGASSWATARAVWRRAAGSTPAIART